VADGRHACIGQQRRRGKWQSLSETGAKRWIVNYKNGQLDGLYRSWYDNVWQEWYENGTSELEPQFDKDGNPKGLTKERGEDGTKKG
jgi:antitoxin component YwqK of YwqJK toxin-antitoxin module